MFQYDEKFPSSTNEYIDIQVKLHDLIHYSAFSAM